MSTQLHPVSSQPWVSYQEMQKSAIVLYDIAAYYLPLYGLSHRNFFNFYPVLGFVEALIYQHEIEIESLNVGEGSPKDWDLRKKLILELLEEQQLEHPRIRQYLDEVGEYFELVQKMNYNGLITHRDVVRAAELRPSDIRLLHALLVCMLDKSFDDQLFELLSPLEVSLEIKANLTEYADDLVTGHHNTYRMFVKLYGEEAPSYLEAEQECWQSTLQERLIIISVDKQQRIKEFMRCHEQDYPSVPIPPIVQEA